MINKILKHSVFKNKPPVLVDLGASGEKKEDWKKLLNHSVTILVDGDSRDFNVDEIGKDKEIKTYKINNIISNSSGLKTFYLTRYPHCSSLLKPNTEILKDWAFKEKFDVIKIQKKKTININKLFKKTKLNYIDWYKTDIQGFDLKLFKSLNKKLQKSITIVDLEVAFYSFYKNEDSIWDVMKTMSKNFFLDEIKIVNTIKGSFKTVNKLSFFEKKGLQMFGKKSPTYTNLSFIKNKNYINLKNKRSILLYIIILILKKRFIEVIDLLNIIKVNKDPIFDDIKSYCYKSINIFSLKYFLRLPITLFLKLKNFS